MPSQYLFHSVNGFQLKGRMEVELSESWAGDYSWERASVAGAAAGAVATPPQSPARPNKRAAEPHYSANIINLTCDQSPSAYKSPPDPELSAETY